MGANKPTNNDAEILRRLNRFTSDTGDSIEELRADLINEGVDPDKLISNVKNTISKFLSPMPEFLTEAPAKIEESAETKPRRFSFKGILATAKEMGIDNFQLADLTRLSVVLIAQLDRGLIKVNEKLPTDVVRRIAEAINVTTEQIIEHLRGGPRFAENANYKAEDAPVLPEAQDFSDAVEEDPVISDEWREELRVLIKAAGESKH
jgi:hypothetical protein